MESALARRNAPDPAGDVALEVKYLERTPKEAPKLTSDVSENEPPAFWSIPLVTALAHAVASVPQLDEPVLG